MRYKRRIEYFNHDLYSSFIKQLQDIDYIEYLKTEHWKHFRAECYKWSGYRCQLCNEKDIALSVHHKTYENRGRETFNDVIVLCLKCHSKIHDDKIINKNQLYEIYKDKPKKLYLRVMLEENLEDVKNKIQSLGDDECGIHTYIHVSDVSMTHLIEQKIYICDDSLFFLYNLLGEENVKLID